MVKSQRVRVAIALTPFVLLGMLMAIVSLGTLVHFDRANPPFIAPLFIALSGSMMASCGVVVSWPGLPQWLGLLAPLAYSPLGMFGLLVLGF